MKRYYNLILVFFVCIIFPALSSTDYYGYSQQSSIVNTFVRPLHVSEIREKRDAVPSSNQTSGSSNSSTATSDLENVNKTIDHTYYIQDVRPLVMNGQSLWRELRNYPNAQTHHYLEGHMQALSVLLPWKFKFYGETLNQVTIGIGGFLYMSSFVHSQLTATQYVAPLMANFDSSLGDNTSSIYWFYDNDVFVVEWTNLHLKDQIEHGRFTFQAQLYKSNGSIVFAYKNVPVNISEIATTQHSVKVGLSDAFYVDNFLTLQRKIYIYHTIGVDFDLVTSGNAIVFTHKTTCNMLTDCDSCHDAKLPGFDCYWCEEQDRCSAVVDRGYQEWLSSNCPVDEESKEVCPVKPTSPAVSTASLTTANTMVTTTITSPQYVSPSEPTKASSSPSTTRVPTTTTTTAASSTTTATIVQHQSTSASITQNTTKPSTSTEMAEVSTQEVMKSSNAELSSSNPASFIAQSTASHAISTSSFSFSSQSLKTTTVTPDSTSVSELLTSQTNLHALTTTALLTHNETTSERVKFQSTQHTTSSSSEITSTFVKTSASTAISTSNSNSDKTSKMTKVPSSTAIHVTTETHVTSAPVSTGDSARTQKSHTTTTMSKEASVKFSTRAPESSIKTSNFEYKTASEVTTPSASKPTGCVNKDGETITDCENAKAQFIKSESDKGGPSAGSVVGYIIAALLVCLVITLVGFLIYGYRNPTSRTGQIMLKYRPSQLRSVFYQSSSGTTSPSNMSSKIMENENNFDNPIYIPNP